MNTQHELKEWLAQQGFRTFPSSTGMAAQGNECTWYAGKRVPSSHRCETNADKDGVSVIVTPYEWRQSGHHYQSVEVDLTGEAGGVWYKLQAHSLPWESLPDKLDAITDGLVLAWETLPR